MLILYIARRVAGPKYSARYQELENQLPEKEAYAKLLETLERLNGDVIQAYDTFDLTSGRQAHLSNLIEQAKDDIEVIQHRCLSLQQQYQVLLEEMKDFRVVRKEYSLYQKRFKKAVADMQHMTEEAEKARDEMRVTAAGMSADGPAAAESAAAAELVPLVAMNSSTHPRRDFSNINSPALISPIVVRLNRRPLSPEMDIVMADTDLGGGMGAAGDVDMAEAAYPIDAPAAIATNAPAAPASAAAAALTQLPADASNDVPAAVSVEVPAAASADVPAAASAKLPGGASIDLLAAASTELPAAKSTVCPAAAPTNLPSAGLLDAWAAPITHATAAGQNNSPVAEVIAATSTSTGSHTPAAAAPVSTMPFNEPAACAAMPVPADARSDTPPPPPLIVVPPTPILALLHPASAVRDLPVRRMSPRLNK